jgi:hypothetical protein
VGGFTKPKRKANTINQTSSAKQGTTHCCHILEFNHEVTHSGVSFRPWCWRATCCRVSGVTLRSSSVRRWYLITSDQNFCAPILRRVIIIHHYHSGHYHAEFAIVNTLSWFFGTVVHTLVVFSISVNRD